MANSGRRLSVVLFAVFLVVCLPAVSAEPRPTIGLLGRAVQRWFREGVRTILGQDEATAADGEGARERMRVMLEERVRTRLQQFHEQVAESRAEDDPTASRYAASDRDEAGRGGGDDSSPTSELIGRFVANAINALQRPDSIVNVMRQKVGFVTANFRLSCYVCEMGVGLSRQFVYANKSIDEIAVTMGNVCRLLTVTSHDVCQGFLKEFLPEILYVLRNVDLLDEEICGFVLGGNCIGRTYKDAFGWSVNIPAKSVFDQPQTIFRRKPYANKLKVLHLTDVHIDEKYVEGSIVDCGEPLCCREKKRGFGFPQSRAGKWGSAGRCDTPERTIDSLLDFLKNFEFDYIIWTGDIPAHNIWEQARDENLELMERFNQKLKNHFPNTPIYPAVGNHESHPANSFPPPSVIGQFSIEYMYDALVNSWTHLVPGNISETVYTGGFYSILARPGLRVISLNTNYCHNKNWWMLLDSKDPAGQLQWLVEELDKAEKNEEKVHIIGHIPPGSVDCAYVWSENFNNIINRYQDTVSAQFYGHSHLDEFEVFYDKQDTSIPINVAYLGSSVSPYDGLNPGFKIYYIDGDYEGSPREILDYEAYYMDLEESNNNDRPVWDILYSAKDAFAMRSLQASEWDRLIGKMASSNELFKDFYRYMHRRTNLKSCTGMCKSLTLCRLRKSWAGATKEC